VRIIYTIPLIVLLFSACDDDMLLRLECRPGEVRLCDYEGNIFEDPTQVRQHFGVCSTGTSTCDRQGTWTSCDGAVGPSVEICDGLDNNCNGGIDEEFPEQQQLCGFEENVSYGVGICAPGVMTCDNGALYCNGHVGPSDEQCDGLDNNCNGSVDEGIANSTAIVCYEGPEGTMAIGECRAGVRYCTDGGFDGPCDGQKIPEDERCDNLDNDCDGEVDEGFDTRGVDLVFVLDISGSFDDEIDSMIQGIAPLLDDPITSTFRFGLVVVGTAGNGEIRPPFQYARMISDFVPANEFLEILESSRSIQSSGLEPTIDTMYWTMTLYPFTWTPGAQRVIITMTDEVAQTTIGMNCAEIATIAHDEAFQLFVFALQAHHNSFLACVGDNRDRLYTPVTNSQTVFEQIRAIFEDLCILR
jgi:hypothetical protein